MMVSISIEGDFTIKNGQIIAITRMSILQMSKDIMTREATYRNEQTLARYDDSVF